MSASRANTSLERGRAESGLLAAFEGLPNSWWLSAEGAVVHRAEGVAVVADVHLGYEWARAARGDCVPAHSLGELIDRLARLFVRVEPRRLVVAGDLVESRRPCVRTEQDVRRLKEWLNVRGIELVVLQGNHDPPRAGMLASRLEIDGWTIEHGHLPASCPNRPRIIGHVHPVLAAAEIRAPCFLVGETEIVLPAFTENAAGLNVLGHRLDHPIALGGYRCVAAAGGELFDFGELARLRRRNVVVSGT